MPRDTCLLGRCERRAAAERRGVQAPPGDRPDPTTRAEQPARDVVSARRRSSRNRRATCRLTGMIGGVETTTSGSSGWLSTAAALQRGSPRAREHQPNQHVQRRAAVASAPAIVHVASSTGGAKRLSSSRSSPGDMYNFPFHHGLASTQTRGSGVGPPTSGSSIGAFSSTTCRLLAPSSDTSGSRARSRRLAGTTPPTSAVGRRREV
jgi:hypothetical protein